MRKELMILLMMVSSVMILSAEGKQDEDAQFYGRGPGPMGGNRFSDEEIAEFQEQREASREEFLSSLETVSLSGPLSLINGQLPYIEKDGTKFSIMAPWFYLDDLELTDGMDVTVEGYIMPGPRLQWDDSEKNVMVTKAVINGEEIEFDHAADAEGFRGGYGGGYCGGYCGYGGFGRSRGGRGGRGFYGGPMTGRKF